MQFALSSETWSDFVGNYWEKRPTLLKKPFGHPVVNPEETMAAVIRACDRRRGGDDSIATSFYIEYARVSAEPLKYLPDSGDESLAAYAGKAKRMLQGRRFGLIVEEIQVHYAEFWLRIREFLHGLYQTTGLPALDSKATVFLGDYEKTPVGLHRGRSSNFMFVVAGRKRIRLWMDEYFQSKRPKFHILDYEQYRDGSILLEGEPGDVIYWPSSCWHIGESSGDFSAGISVALFRSNRASFDLIRHTNRLLQQQLGIRERTGGFHFPLVRVQETVKGLPALAELARTSVKEVAEGSRLVPALSVSWLNYLTGYGFYSVPPPAEWQTLKAEDVVSGWAEFPILWIPLPENKLACSVNGHAFEVPANPNLVGLLQQLSTGAKNSVGDLLRQFAGAVESEASVLKLRLLLEKLLSLRAIRIH